MSFALECGCKVWSEERQDLPLEWCPEHYAQIQAESEARAERSRRESLERVQFSADQVWANIERLGA